MTLEERSNLVLAFAQVLFVNGQATEQTVTAAEQLGHALGLRAKVMPRWGELLILRNSAVNPHFPGLLPLSATILLPNAASMIWAARSSVPRIRWPYVFRVIVGEASPVADSR